MIERPYYLNQLLRAKDTDFIKIITGIRRSGKSTLLEMLKKHLLTQGVPENHVIHISYEQIPWFPLEKAETLYAYIKEHITEPAHRYYLLIDEVQELKEWAKVINGLKATFPLDIYITGSNSRLFSGEYLTYITGRYIEIKVYPLSLSEFMTFRGYDESNVAKAFNEYLTIGSFPAAAVAKDPELTEIINSGLFDSIFARDIIIRGGIRNEGVFLKAAKFIMENIGNPLSVSAISRTLKSQGSSASADTIDNYLTQMVNAYVLYPCERYDIRGKERLRTNGKYYVADLGLRNRLIGYRRGNLGHVIENLPRTPSPRLYHFHRPLQFAGGGLCRAERHRHPLLPGVALGHGRNRACPRTCAVPENHRQFSQVPHYHGHHRFLTEWHHPPESL